MTPYSYEKSIEVGANNGRTISIASTPMITSRVFVSERAFPSFEGSVSFLNKDSLSY